MIDTYANVRWTGPDALAAEWTTEVDGGGPLTQAIEFRAVPGLLHYDAVLALGIDPGAPPVPRRLVPKSLIISRLTDAQLAAAIGAMTIRQQERWRAPDKPAVYADDPEALALLQAVGADPEVVMAPERGEAG